MPPAEATPVTQLPDSAPYPRPDAAVKSHYGLRGKKYQYSHTKPPAPAPPPRNTTRPQLPASAAGKKKGRNSDKSILEPQEADHSANRGSESNDVAGSGLPCEQPDLDAMANGEAHGLANGHSTLMPVAEEQNSQGWQEGPLGQSEMNSETQARGEVVPVSDTPSTQMTPVRYPDIQIVQPTPNRAGLRGAGTWGSFTPGASGVSCSNASPLALRFGTPPDWAFAFEDENSSNHGTALPSAFPSTIQNPGPAAPSLESAGLSNTSTGNAPTSMPDLTRTWPSPTLAPATRTDPAYLSIHDSGPQRIDSPAEPWPPSSTNRSDSDGVAQAASRHPTPQPHTTELSTLHRLVTESLRPDDLPIPARTVSPAQVPPPLPWGPGVASANTQASLNHLSASGMGSRGPSPVPTNWRSPSPAQFPPGASSRSTTPATLSAGTDRNSQTGRVRSINRGSFSASQYKFVQAMTHRWHWSILSEFAFPVDTTKIAEECFVYAEGALGVSRLEEDMPPFTWGYVHAKGPRIRNDSQNGVLSLVETLYNVTKDDKPRIKELTNYSNFIYVAYDPKNLSKVKGRFKHPCIAEVIKSMLFPPVTRGKSIGARFIYELIAVTPHDVLQGYVDKTANYGVPIQVIALACTLILYSLHLLEQGYSSKDPKTKRAPGLEERTYLPYYRGYLKKMKDYEQLGQLRRHHMKPLLDEHTKQYPHSIALEEEDIERFSDED